MSWLYSKWWKWLCVALLFYVIAGSFFVPLAPGITKVEPETFTADSVYTFAITGYHSHFKDAAAGKVQLWFKSGNDYFRPTHLQIENDQLLYAQFSVPSVLQSSLKRANIDIVVNDDYDGTFVLREGVTFIKKGVDSTFSKDSTQIKGLTSDLSLIPDPRPGKDVKTDKHQFFSYPYREILYESMRNTFFHVPMWFVMTLLVIFSVVYSILYLIKGDIRYDIYAHQAVVVAILFGLCGYATGMVWSKYTWFIGMPWSMALGNMVFKDIKLAGALIGIAVYLAYLVLRGSLTDEIKRARISASYNIIGVVVFVLFIFILPRITNSLHPGNGGNPAFSKYDLDSTMRLFFYPAVIGWILLGLWILSIRIRMELIKQKQEL